MSKNQQQDIREILEEEIQEKRDSFSLEPEGHSIHTMEIARRLTGYEYSAVVSDLRKRSKDKEFYPLSKGYHFCGLYCKHGIRIYLDNHNHKGIESYYLRMIINPRKLLDPNSSYRGILEPTEDNIWLCKENFKWLFSDTPIEDELDVYELKRLDFCANLLCDGESAFKEVLRLLHKSPTFGRYKRVLYSNEKGNKKQKMNNKDFVKYACKSHSIMIYNKTKQLQKEELEDCEDNILRFELQCERKFIREYEKKHDFPNNPDLTDLLWHMVVYSKDNLLDYVERCFGFMDFLPQEELNKKIDMERYRKKTKKKMKKLVDLMTVISSVKDAFQKMDLSEEEGRKLLKKFQRMSYSPVPIRKNFTGDFLYGPVILLLLCEDEFRFL